MGGNQPKLEVDVGNVINIDPDTSYSASRIIIKGTGNQVKIDGALHFNKLTINLKGNNKNIHIALTNANINNLKITSIRADNQIVKIGKNFSCGGLEIQMNDGDEELRIGDDCLFSWGIKMRTSDGHSVVDLVTGRAINTPKNVVIASRVWVGEDVRFLKGARIPQDVIVGAGAVVTKSFHDDDANCVIGGFPAKVLTRNVTWDRRKPSEYNFRPRNG